MEKYLLIPEIFKREYPGSSEVQRSARIGCTTPIEVWSILVIKRTKEKNVKVISITTPGDMH
jgi:hypothetical protein